MYRVLDVREVIEISSGSVSNHSYGWLLKNENNLICALGKVYKFD
jgi:hypothetical protein